MLKGRYLTLNTVVRVNQIEVTRERNAGLDEFDRHTPERVASFRDAVELGWPGSRITWGLSWRALWNKSLRYAKIREMLKGYREHHGDEITFLPGAYFANAYNTRAQVNRDLHEGLGRISDIVGSHYRPKSVIAGFLSSANQAYLAEHEGIHVCQGNVWSQYAIDNQDGDGSICYPYYPSREHFCKPAQAEADRVDCVNLDGWTVDFLAARREGFANGFNSRMGVGPIETLGKYGAEVGLRQMMATTATHYDTAFQLNGMAWVTNNWEISLVSQFGLLSELTDWLRGVRKRWPDARLLTQGEFGLLWRKQCPNNDGLDYRFVQRGTGIGGSDRELEIKWYMNRGFRLALLRNWQTGEASRVIDYTRYDLPAAEPTTLTRSWSLLGDINQKQTRPQDRSVHLSELAPEDQERIVARYSELATLARLP